MARPEDEAGHRSGGDGFLNRWARRKQAARIGVDPDAPAPPPPDPWRAGQPAPPAVAAQPDAASARAEGETVTPPLPSLESIVPGSDVTAFFQSHVPEALRTAALRKLWVTDPEIKGFVEVADYQWDFANPDSIPGFASRLPEVDVAALAKRLLGGGRPDPERSASDRHSDGGSAPVAAATADPRPEQALPDAAEVSTAVETTEQAPRSPHATNGPQRRRHGGALPT